MTSGWRRVIATVATVTAVYALTWEEEVDEEEDEQ